MRPSLKFCLAILGIFAVVYAIYLASQRRVEGDPVSPRTDINGGIKSALGAYEVDNGHYPTNLQDLVQLPADDKNWRGPYLEKLPIDPWGDKYI